MTYSQEAGDGFSYIWDNYQKKPTEIGSLDPTSFNFDTLLNVWATTAVVRSNFISNRHQEARYVFDTFLKEEKKELLNKHFGTWVEVQSVEALLARKEWKYEQADSLYTTLIGKALHNDTENQYGQIALAYFHKAGIARQLVKPDSIDLYYSKAAEFGYLAKRNDIVFDAITNHILYLTGTQKGYDKAEFLLKEAEELTLSSSKSRILYTMASAKLNAYKNAEFDTAISDLKEARTLAELNNEWELFSQMADMIMSLEVMKELHFEAQTKRLFGFLAFIALVFMGYLNYLLIRDKRSKAKKEPVKIIGIRKNSLI